MVYAKEYKLKTKNKQNNKQQKTGNPYIIRARVRACACACVHAVYLCMPQCLPFTSFTWWFFMSLNTHVIAL